MSRNRTPEELLRIMWQRDYFSQWLGLQDITIEQGYCSLSYIVRKEMLNGFGSIHGGVLFSAADSALAFAANASDILSVALEVSISFTKSAREGDLLRVVARSVTENSKTGIYDIITTNQQGEIISIFKGTVYKTTKQLP